MGSMPPVLHEHLGILYVIWQPYVGELLKLATATHHPHADVYPQDPFFLSIMLLEDEFRAAPVSGMANAWLCHPCSPSPGPPLTTTTDSALPLNNMVMVLGAPCLFGALPRLSCSPHKRPKPSHAVNRCFRGVSSLHHEDMRLRMVGG